MRRALIGVAVVMLAAAPFVSAAEFDELWVYSAPNFADDADIDNLIAVM